MLKNYFKSAWRATWKNRSVSLINIIGLSIGMTAAVFILLWVQNEMSYDNFQPGNVYRITHTSQSGNATSMTEVSPQPLAEAAAKGIPEVEKTAMLKPLIWGGNTFNINKKLFTEKTSAFVDKTWFNIFNYKFVQGNAVSFAQNPYSIVLTESKAKKYFGNALAVGQVITVDTLTYTVAGVVKDNPLNSSFQFDVFLQFGSYLNSPSGRKYTNDWNNYNYITFLQITPGTPKETVETKLNAIINTYTKGNTDGVKLQALKDMYFEEGNVNSNLPHGNRKTTYIFIMLGLLLLITACINYVNLTTARASIRAKEVSIRKMVGAEKSNLFFQFIMESLVISFISLLFTLLFIQVLLPLFNIVTEKNFQFPLTSGPMWQVLLGTLLLTTVLNGIYPALLLSSFNPLNVFRGRSVLKIRDGAIRKGLVVFQFSLSIMLITGTIVMYRQLHYIQVTNPGYNISQVAEFSIPYQTYSKVKDEDQSAFFAAIRHELLVQPGITGVCTGDDEIIDVGSYSSGNADWDGRDTAYRPKVARMYVDEDFQKIFGLQLKSGRWFSNGKRDYPNYIINETAEATFNMHKPVIGQRFIWGGDTGQVIGVVKDFHYKSMHEKIGPIVLLNDRGNNGSFFIKIAAGNIPKALAGMSGVWNKFVTGRPFEYNFLDDSFNNLYKADVKTSYLILIFSIIAIIISAMGLFGLAAFTAEQRTREIGIRKVFGASVKQITVLLSKDFIMLVVAAIIIATPVAWWLMSKWLQDFAYRINLSTWIFIGAAALALLIAVLSVSIQAIKTAMANPIGALRGE